MYHCRDTVVYTIKIGAPGLKSPESIHGTKQLCDNYWLASSPGLPMFFNVTYEKLGRPGQFCDVIITCCHGSLSPPTRLRNRVHIASYGSLRASKDTVAKELVPRKLPIKMTTEGVWGRC